MIRYRIFMDSNRQQGILPYMKYMHVMNFFFQIVNNYYCHGVSNFFFLHSNIYQYFWFRFGYVEWKNKPIWNAPYCFFFVVVVQYPFFCLYLKYFGNRIQRNKNHLLLFKCVCIVYVWWLSINELHKLFFPMFWTSSSS